MTDKSQFDFGGYASRSGKRCADGRTIAKHAFKENYGKKVPLVWQHLHDDPTNVLGHAILEDRDGDVYSFCKFNNTPAGEQAKALVAHGDIDGLSIFANQLVERDHLVHSGNIREVSLVLAGANPGAKIDYINIAHSDGEVITSDSEAIIYMDAGLELSHADGRDEETVQDVFDTLDEKQKKVVMAMIAMALEEGASSDSAAQSAIKEDDNTVKSDDKEGEKVMKENAFDVNTKEKGTLRHSLTPDQFKEIMADAIKTGSFKQSFLAHVATYGIENIDFLFPEAKTIGEMSWIKRDTGWVSRFYGPARKNPFSRIKSMAADITADDARAKGYVKGSLKKEEVIKLLKRTTGPTTIYKKQKLDRDDIVDITDLDVVAWLKGEMRLMLDEEIARAGLIGDGRAADHEDKINEECIRPIYKDDDMYAYHVYLDSDATTLEVIDSLIRYRKEYKGDGNPVFFISQDFLADMLLLRDQFNHRLYKSVDDLATELRVSSIVEVPLMTGVSRTVDGSTLTPEVPDFDTDLMGIMVNPSDYTYGADKGGNIALFDDFDIDYNQYKYLMETRCSACLTKPRTALVIERKQAQG